MFIKIFTNDELELFINSMVNIVHIKERHFMILEISYILKTKLSTTSMDNTGETINRNIQLHIHIFLRTHLPLQSFCTLYQEL